MSKPAKPELARILPELMQWLTSRNYHVVTDAETAVYMQGPEIVEREKMGAQALNFVIVLGGDGTFLSAARVVAKTGIPILGINLGTLGFLTEVPLAELYDSLEAVDQQRCPIEERSLIHSQLVRGGECIANFDSLNDVIVSKASIARLASFELYIDQMFVSNYKADGLIISTPTGSTAYSLSVGGPIIEPTVEVLVVSPISPHTLSNRPVVLRPQAVVRIAIASEQQDAVLTVDGQEGTPLLAGDVVVVRRAAASVSLVRSPDRTHYDVLRSKLGWGTREGGRHAAGAARL